MNAAQSALAAATLRGQRAKTMPNAPENDDAPQSLEAMARLPPEERPPAAARAIAAFGRNFRVARQAAKLSQQEVERLSGVPQHYISTIERGRENPTLGTMARLAAAIGKPLTDLVKL